jgi:dephospho-CoA kinase
VHPLVAADRAAWLAGRSGPVVLDVPLLYETGLDGACDRVAVVSTEAATQRARVLARGVTAEALDAILARQLPDAEKRARADYVVPTDDMEGARAAVARIVAELGAGKGKGTA